MSKLKHEEKLEANTAPRRDKKKGAIRVVFRFMRGGMPKIKLANDSKKSDNKGRKNPKKERNHAIMGIGQLLVVVSIAYSTAVIFIGVDSTASKIALIPQVVFASYILLKAFSRLYK